MILTLLKQKKKNMHLISKFPDKHYTTHNPGELEKSLFSGERKLQRSLLIPTHSVPLQSCASTSEKVFSLFKIFNASGRKTKYYLNLNDLDIMLQNVYCEILVWKGMPLCVQVRAHTVK